MNVRDNEEPVEDYDNIDMEHYTEAFATENRRIWNQGDLIKSEY